MTKYASHLTCYRIFSILVKKYVLFVVGFSFILLAENLVLKKYRTSITSKSCSCEYFITLNYNNTGNAYLKTNKHLYLYRLFVSFLKLLVTNNNCMRKKQTGKGRYLYFP